MTPVNTGSLIYIWSLHRETQFAPISTLLRATRRRILALIAPVFEQPSTRKEGHHATSQPCTFGCPRRSHCRVRRICPGRDVPQCYRRHVAEPAASRLAPLASD